MGTGGVLPLDHRKFFVRCPFLKLGHQLELPFVNWLLHKINLIISVFLLFLIYFLLFRLYNQRLFRSFHFVSTTTAAFLNFRSHNLFALLSASRFRCARFIHFLGKALVLLVSLALICCHTYSYDLSTTWSAWGLTWLPSERTHLSVGFVLICFQHLSASNTATGRLPLAG